MYFNPHEREARDNDKRRNAGRIRDFNPHEREARDPASAYSPTARIYFNPHEREARDDHPRREGDDAEIILIHTSVKLVTRRESSGRHARKDFNPHEREARDNDESHA